MTQKPKFNIGDRVFNKLTETEMIIKHCKELDGEFVYCFDDNRLGSYCSEEALVHLLSWNAHEGASVLMKNNQQIESPPCSFIAISGDQPRIIGIRRDDVLKLCNTIEEAERFIKYKF